MAEGNDLVSLFYTQNLNVTWKAVTTTDCPFCRERGFEPGQLTVFLKKDSFFHGYFRCLNRCVPGGFPLWFAQLATIPLRDVPGYSPDLELMANQPEYPVDNINDDVRDYRSRLTEDLYAMFLEHGVTKSALSEMGVGFNGRYLVYPYFQEDGNCYSARCVHPGKREDFFWHGNQEFSVEPFNLFNIGEIGRCENGALFICEGEENLLVLKQLGFPGVAVSHFNGLEKLSADMFVKVKTVFISVKQSQESLIGAKNLASRIGYKARILYWGVETPAHYSLWDLARDMGKNFGVKIGEMVKNSRAFSPFFTPVVEFTRFLQTLQQEQGEEYQKLSSGFPILDRALGGIHGINVLGGAPKVGKSTFMIQLASEMAGKGIPVLYYDFENGRQKIYQRTLSRLSRLATDRFNMVGVAKEEQLQYEKAIEKLRSRLFFMRVINDRKVTPEVMRKHIDFIRHETRSEYTIVVIDSLHKLPFNDFAEQRTGIDAWLRQFESIRDELQVSFLVISELSRGAAGSYQDTPHLGIFKGSGDIEYSADNAMVICQEQAKEEGDGDKKVVNNLWVVASREHSPGRIAGYKLDYPFWGFIEYP